MYLKYYLKKLGGSDFPQFLLKYLSCPSLLRLKEVGYFCGMDYASKDIYNFSEYISRFDHSLTTSLLVYRLTHDKKATIAALLHDIATPCFSHVIDYMNNDFEKQESTEEYTKEIIMNDIYLQICLKKDNINPEDVINFKKYSIVDNDRPKLCADRLDGIILTGIGWTKDITEKEIDKILNDIIIINNEDNEPEIGFRSIDIASKVLEVSNKIDEYCHTKEDNYMMILLGNIVKLAINKGYTSYELLFRLKEETLFNLLENKSDEELSSLITKFKTIKKEEISDIEVPNVKRRILSPLVAGNRIN